MKKALIPLVVIVVIGAVGYLVWQKSNVEKAPAPVVEAPADEAAEKYPVAASSQVSTVHSADEVDQDLQKKAPDVFGQGPGSEVVIFENFVRRFVVAIDNALGKQIPLDLSPLKTAPGEIIVTPQGKDYVISDKNAERYQAYMQLIEKTDLSRAVQYYRQIYPLLQATYKELGTSKYFNDRVIEVLDSVVATPDVTEPLHLQHPSVRYTFADPQLEALPAIQKIVLRMGPQNEKIIKGKAQDLKQMLTQLKN